LAGLSKRAVVLHAHASLDSVLRAVASEPPPKLFEFETRLDVGGESVVLFDATPGAGSHGVVVWLPRSRILFGGGLVLSIDARQLEVPPGLDVERWRVGARRTIERFRNAAMVVPARGRAGGPGAALAHDGAARIANERTESCGDYSAAMTPYRNGRDSSSR
jgi:glyoxylase-like metal-dependent hydrolase (beta-lactamase superfamily II)